MRRWLLPEAVEDALPATAAQLERLRRRLLDAYRGHGYQLVAPPLFEHLDSLLTGTGRDLDLRTFKLVDQLSGRTLGVRADITPQVARIDAHMLNRSGVTRLCYCGSVLHTLPASPGASREPLQIGAELYGHAGVEADVEVLRLLAESLALADVADIRLELGHVGVFRALALRAGMDAELEEELFSILQAKDVPALRELVRGIAEPMRSALLALPECYGGAQALVRARAILPPDEDIVRALAELERLGESLRKLPVGFDLADLRGYHYHSGVVFAAYCSGHAGAIALGGRYDMVGRHFGRGRPATGFSMDLRELAAVAAAGTMQSGILAPCSEDSALRTAIERLRARGEIVVAALPGHAGTWREAGCDRELVLHEGAWQIVPLEGEQE
jgi:ATP phosphoribosyltransferase regulatory subunit